MDKIVELITHDAMRIEALECVFQLDLPQCYLAAGFVRNLVWDYLHEKPEPTPLNDVDVIYFDPDEEDQEAYLEYEATLTAKLPLLNWQVRNQALMHVRNGDLPYRSSIDAMSYSPEKETAVGIRKGKSGDYECISAYGFDSLFNFQITSNPKRKREVFERRVASKGWLKQWPSLQVARY